MISERLKILANYVNKNDIVGDIGTDHGFIPIYLIENNKINKMIASDLNEGPLDNAKKELSLKGFLNKVDLRIGSGLVPYTPGEINTAIIAGMGGNLIRTILIDGKEHIKYLNKLILQPMHGVEELRRWILNNGFRIIDEDLLFENNIFYEIIVAEKGETQKYDELNLEFGFNMLNKNPEISKSFLDMKIQKIERIVEDIESHGSSMSQLRKEQFKDRIKQYYEVRKCL
ncbi:class I SAM-dependent methyltransferase [Clostridiaceae bacterium HSG29]|nr:class I SAM-dependent methyltransferase [Clostridiaceae bacterium HSG29]